MEISHRVFELLPGHEIMTDEQADRRMDKVIATGLRRLRLAGPQKQISISFGSTLKMLIGEMPGCEDAQVNMRLYC